MSRTQYEPWSDLQERYRARVDEFKSRQISAEVFRASLYALGFRGQELSAEVDLNKPEDKVK